MKPILTLTCLLVLTAFGVMRLRVFFAADETLITWRIEEATEGFNDTRTSKVLAVLSKEYRDDAQGLDRVLFQQVLVHTFFTEVDPKTKRFRMRARVPEEHLAIEVTEEGKAEARLRVEFEILTGEDWSSQWVVDLDTWWSRGEEEGWQVTRSLHRTVAGEPPG